MIVSPDGRYLSLVLTSDESQSGVPATDRHTHVVVLDTQTGKAVRTAEVSGIVLGQALTNSSLAVETSQNYFPAGSGKGSVRVFSITSSGAQESSFSTDQWLIGIDNGALLLSPQSLVTERRTDVSVTLTRVDTRGRELGTIDGVTAPDRKHWERPKPHQ